MTEDTEYQLQLSKRLPNEEYNRQPQTITEVICPYRLANLWFQMRNEVFEERALVYSAREIIGAMNAQSTPPYHPERIESKGAVLCASSKIINQRNATRQDRATIVENLNAIIAAYALKNFHQGMKQQVNKYLNQGKAY